MWGSDHGLQPLFQAFPSVGLSDARCNQSRKAIHEVCETGERFIIPPTIDNRPARYRRLFRFKRKLMDWPHFDLSLLLTKKVLRGAQTGKNGNCICGQAYDTRCILKEDGFIL
jgi:hypothetical protein